jgi:hypothetical protein
MSNTIITKHNTATGNSPAAGDLSIGELAVNTADKKIFTKDSAGAIVELGGGGSGSGVSTGKAIAIAMIFG